MKHLLLYILLFASKSHISSQNFAFPELYQLDSIGKSNSITKHFGELYFRFLGLVEKRLENADTGTQRLVRNFEAVFARFYIQACESYRDNRPIALTAWRAYFSDTTLSPIQYKLLGANAHLNGGLSEAIAGSYTAEEWKTLQPQYVLFNKCLNETYGWVYDEARSTSKKAKTLSILTLGMDRLVGNYYLYKWRKRQMKLSRRYYEDDEKYAKLLKKVTKKKEKIDYLVIKNIR